MASRTKVVVEIVAEAKGFEKQMNQANRELGKLRQSAERFNRVMDTLGRFAGFTILGASLRDLGAEFLRINLASERLQKGFTAVLGSQQLARQEMEYAMKVANELGIEYLTATRALVSLNAASKGSKLEGKATRDVFEAVSRAMAKLGKSADDTQGALRAIEQMMNKGKVMAEELRGQLGERLPGAVKIAADALGVTTGELNAMQEAGKVLTDDFLPKFTAQLNKLYDDGKEVEGLIAAWNRFKNAMTETVTTIDEVTGATDSLETALNGLSNILLVVTDNGGKAEQAALDFAMGAIEATKQVDLLTRTVWQLIDAYRSLSGAPTPVSPAFDATTGGSATNREPAELAKWAETERLEKWGAAAEAELAAMEKAEQVSKNLAWGAAQRYAPPSGGGGGGGGGGSRRRGGRASRGNNAADQLARDAEAAERALRSLRGTLDETVRIQNQLEDRLAVVYEAGKFGLFSNVEDAANLEQAIREQANSAIEELNASLEETSELGDAIGDSFSRAFEDLIRGASDAKGVLQTLLTGLASDIFSAGVSPISKGISGGISKFVTELFADGGVTSTGLPHGVYNRPTAFPINGPSKRFASGTGILGEAGPEAIMPLKRGKDGKLGVQGGGTNVTVHNYSGAEVQTRPGMSPGDLEIVIGRVTSDITRGGSPLSHSIEATYGLTRGRLRG